MLDLVKKAGEALRNEEDRAEEVVMQHEHDAAKYRRKMEKKEALAANKRKEIMLIRGKWAMLQDEERMQQFEKAVAGAGITDLEFKDVGRNYYLYGFCKLRGVQAQCYVTFCSTSFKLMVGSSYRPDMEIISLKSGAKVRDRRLDKLVGN